MAALEAAMDSVPLTAEQRNKLREEFALRAGAEIPFTQNPAYPVNSSFPTAPAVSSQPPSPPPPPPIQMNMPVGLAAVSANLPFAGVPPNTTPVPPSPLNVSVNVAAPQPVPAVSIAPEKMIQWTPPGGPDPKLPVTESDVSRRLEMVLEQKRQEQRSVSFLRGLFDSVFLGAVLGAIVMGIGLGLSQAPALLLTYGVQTMILVAVGFILLYLMGSIIEKCWGGKRSYGILSTVFRGIAGPILVPLGLLVCLHEKLWGQAYGVHFGGRFLRSLVSPVTIPAGVAWDISGAISRLFGARATA